MPAIMLPKMLARSKPSLGGGRRSSSNWSHKSSLYSRNASVDLKMALDRRQSMEGSMQGQARYDSDHSTSSDAPDDWGFFVDIGEQIEDRDVERTFLNGINSSIPGKLRTIADARF